jgi:uncharacterized LabA/DUF88 family protein
MPMTDPRSYLFIDGGYLREVLRSFTRDYFGVAEAGIDHSYIGQKYRRVFYYDCPANQGDEATWDEQFEPIQKLPGWHVFTGAITGRRRTQKQVDVKIAVDMLSHTLNSNMDSAALLAGDQDFVPVLDALVRAGMYVSLIYEPKSASRELIRMSDEANELTPATLRRWCDSTFRREHELPSPSTFEPMHVQQAMERPRNTRWETIADGATREDIPITYFWAPEPGCYIAYLQTSEISAFGFTHRELSPLLRFVNASGHAYTLNNRTQRFLDNCADAPYDFA